MVGSGLTLSLGLEMCEARLVYWSSRTSGHLPTITIQLVTTLPPALATLHTRQQMIFHPPIVFDKKKINNLTEKYIFMWLSVFLPL